MRIAHLILTHAHPERLARLIGRLAHKDADIYVHVDMKAAIEPFLPLQEMGNVYFVNNRVKVYWGGYSIVQATINGMEEILAAGKQYGYINLLSGQDHPIKSTEAIHKFFKDDPGKAFMHTLSVEHEWQEAIPRITKYHLANLHFRGRYAIERIINVVMPKRKFPDGMIPVGRSQWFTITPAHAAYIIGHLKAHPSIVSFFKLTWAPDEMIFQTILYNSPHREEMVNDNLLYVDWSAGGASPKVLTMADAAAIIGSGKLFARKFDPDKDNKILDHLDNSAHQTI